MSEIDLKSYIRNIPDFPKPGILFRDITPLLADGKALAAAIDRIAVPYLGTVDTILGIESRGFIIGAPVAYRLGVGLAIARKPGKLPYRIVEESYELEYGEASLQLHEDGIVRNSRVLIVDDLLATGGTARAATQIVTRLGGEVVACAFLVELAFLNGRDRLAPFKCSALIRYD